MDGIVVIDPAGNVALFNPAAECMFGYSAAEVLGTPARHLVPAAFGELEGDRIATFLKERLPELLGQPQEFTGRRKNGSDFPVEISLSLLTEPSDPNHPGRILAAIRDLTERNKMRAFMVQNEKLASIGLLSAGVAHEINNPLAFVANNLAVLERDSKGLLEVLGIYESVRSTLDAELAGRIQSLAETIDLDYIRANLGRILARTRDGIDRVTRIVHSLRGMARTEAPRRQDVNVAEIFNSSLEILHGKYKRLGVTVNQKHDPRPTVPCVPTQISQVILNLLVNAFQAIETSKRIDGRIDIRTERRTEQFIMEIRDNGIGIAQADLPRVFDPFFTTKDVGEGTGLGLSISHHIVEAHGGRIDVESNAGAETCFRVILPMKETKH
jgi:PAS domain S-box-containing protein